MIIKLQTALWPAPIVIDTDERSSGAGTDLLRKVIKPKVEIAYGPGESPLMTWAPGGDPDRSWVPFLVVAGLSLLVTFAIVGVARS